MAIRVEVITFRMEAVASRLEAIALRMEAVRLALGQCLSGDLDLKTSSIRYRMRIPKKILGNTVRRLQCAIQG